jgi:HSP20 family molecular chaperone IbpA
VTTIADIVTLYRWHEAKLHAGYQDGVLELTMPKKAGNGRGKHIVVN